MRKRMGPDRCVWGATAVTEKEAKRNKYGCKILSIVELDDLYLLSILFILLFEIKIDTFSEIILQRRASIRVVSMFGK